MVNHLEQNQQHTTGSDRFPKPVVASSILAGGIFIWLFLEKLSQFRQITVDLIKAKIVENTKKWCFRLSVLYQIEQEERKAAS